MALYRLPELNLLPVLNHLPSYGLTVVQITSATVDGELVYTLELDGAIPESEIPHLNTGGVYLEVL